MPISNSSSAQNINTNTSVSSDPELPTFNFIAGWILLITILVFASKSRIGYVIIYYSLLLMILFILLTEYQQISPLLDSIQTVGQFNSTQEKTVG
jgi:hypothetical protein